MLKLLGILFLALIAFLIIGIALFARILGSFLVQKGSSFRKQTQADNTRKETTNTSTKTDAQTRKASKREKLFGKEEGEYVEYEEIKD